jgi:tetratricopeptide (TPR) repeat protein
MEEEEDEKYEDSFVAEVRRFVQRTAETFDLVTKEELVSDRGPTLHNFRSEDSFKYAEPDALEYHMQVPKVMRRQSFFKLVEPGDVMQGHVVAKRYSSGLAVQITSFVNSHKYRELSDLAIKGVVPFDNLTENQDKCEEVMRDMQLGDVVQAVVVTVDLEEEALVLTFQTSDLCGVESASLGYRAGRRPASPRPSAIKDSEFLEGLEGDQGFINPEARSNLYQSLGLAAATSFRHTLYKDLQTADYAEGDFAGPLRKAQRFKWSMKTVAVGVDHFKSGRHKQARQILNHALDIDPSNVEGLVARGALSATTGLFRDGIADFRKALSLNASHKNARNYLLETQVVYGKRLEAQGRVEEAMGSYREALEFDPGEETAKGRLEALVAAMEIKPVY